jgi:cytochrome oxidase Cu insertion factor (SCO1/SenC/PrrC family)
MSKSSGPNVRVFAWSVLGVVLLAVVALFIRAQAQKSDLPHLGQVQPFQLTNQSGQATTARDLQGKVWVGDIIFTRCGGPCPKMTEEMGRLEKAIPLDPSLRFVTLTTDPENDTPSVLKSYGEKFGADFSRWMFLTGTKTEIKKLAVESWKLPAFEKDIAERESENDLFVHSTMFVLIDKSGTMRGVYESLEPGFQEKIRADIQSLLKENP